MRTRTGKLVLLLTLVMLGAMIFVFSSCGEPTTYNITFSVNGTETVVTVEEGTVPAFTGSTVKAQDAQYVYTFSGWDTEPVAAAADATYTAQYTTAARKYDITFSVNGTDTKVSTAYGATPVFTGSTDKAQDTEKVYTFAGWDKEIVAVTGAATYTAQYNSTARKYDITFSVNGTDTKVSTAYGATPAFEGSTAKASDDNYSYTFSGWDKTVVPVTGEATYTAQYTQGTRKYDITFSVGGTDTVVAVEKGTLPVFTGSTDKAKDDDYVYTFSGWDKTFVAATGDTTYTAQYTTVTRLFDIVFVVDGAETKYQLAKGETPVFAGVTDKAKDDTKIYEFTGWDKTIVAVAADATYTAKYKETVYVFLDQDYTGVTIASSDTTNATDPDYPKLSYGTSGKTGTAFTTETGTDGNTYLKLTQTATTETSDPAMNFMPSSGGLANAMGDFTAMIFSVRLAKQDDMATNAINIRMRSSKPNSSSNTIPFIRSTGDGIVYLGTDTSTVTGKALTTLTSTYQTISVKIDFATLTLTGYVDGVEIATTAFSIPAASEVTSGSGIDWLETCTSYAFNWYFGNSAGVDRVLLIDDIRLEAAIPAETPAAPLS